jgi:flagellum-specific peptidoglycan hydrolase FlgJ
MNIAGLTTSQGLAEKSVKDQADRLVGSLWYTMLSELEKTSNGNDTSDIGKFQDMFDWTVAENDFSTYDSSLVQSIVNQISSSQSSKILENKKPSQMERVLPTSSLGDGVSTEDDCNASNDATYINYFSNSKDFFTKIWPDVSRISNELKVPAIGILAQVILETGWGKSIPNNNVFGIKLHLDTNGQELLTTEFQKGKFVKQLANFQAYDSTDTASSDYINLIRSKYHAAMDTKTVQDFANGLQKSGYATDPEYAEKIIDISNSLDLKNIIEAVSRSRA